MRIASSRQNLEEHLAQFKAAITAAAPTTYREAVRLRALMVAEFRESLSQVNHRDFVTISRYWLFDYRTRNKI